jgi:hypothetical protein
VRASEDLTHLLSHGHRFGVHVVAATCDGDVEREPLVDLFSSHLVFGLEDEEASTRLLGTPWALTLAEPGRVLVRVGQRKEVEALGLHLTEQGRLELLASMGVADPASATGQFADALERAPDSAHEVMAGSAEEARKAPPEPTTETSGEKSDVADVQTQTQSAPDSMATVAETTVERAESNRQPERADKPTGSESNVDHDDTRSHKSTAVAAASGRPERIRKLLERTQLVVDCEEASVWSARGRLGIGQSSPVEVLLYVAAAPLLHQGRLAEWSGVKPETLLAEIWAPRARDPDNRDSAQTWLGKNLGRLQDEIGGATGGLDAQMIVKRQGGLYLNEDIVVSDVEAFMAALERARAAQGPDQIKATEEVFALRTSGLLSRVVRKPRTAGPKVE